MLPLGDFGASGLIHSTATPESGSFAFFLCTWRFFFCVLGAKIQEKLQKDRSTTCSEAAGSVSQGRTISGNTLPAIDHKSDVVNHTLIWSLPATAIFVGVGTSFGCRYFEKQPSFPHSA